MLSVVFRAKYLAGLQALYGQGRLKFSGATSALAGPRAFGRFVQRLKAKTWVVYAKPPFGGPAQVLEYLGRYTHRVAISNDRIVGLEDGEVAFRCRGRRSRGRVKRLSAEAFIGRFLRHVLPAGFVRIRYVGLLAHRGKTERLARCRALLGQAEPAAREPETAAAFMRRVAGIDIDRCPVCQQGRLGAPQGLPARVQAFPSPLLAPPATGPPQTHG
jgi:hypothetical protein